MSRKANPTIIGAFVLGAVIIAIVGIVFLSPGVGEDRETYQLYFEGSVKGLNAGAPVMVKGVRVGTVRDISLRMDMTEHAQYIVPVVIELSQRHLLSHKQTTDADMTELVKKGLRAQLEVESLVTQKLFIELAFRPDTEAKFYPHSSGQLQEIPTVQTPWQELQAGLADVDIGQLATKATSVLDGINRILNGPELMQTLTTLEQSLSNINILVSGLAEDRGQLSGDLQLTLAETRATFAEARKALTQMDQTLKSGNAVMADTQELVQQIDQVMVNLGGLTGDDSPTVYRVEVALDEITDTAQAMRRFVEMLERKPNALLLGM